MDNVFSLPTILFAIFHVGIDDHVRARGETRSGFLAEAARAAMR